MSWLKDESDTHNYLPDSTASLFINLCSYFEGDLQKVLDELLPLLEKGRDFKDAYQYIVNSHSFEDCYYI